jgi:branched-subunit amino acid ABC-type transport system permease component
VFDLSLVPPILIVGIVLAGLYGLLPVAVVLTYRISRTIGFVHGGIAIFGGVFYQLLANGPANDRGFITDPVMDPRAALLCTIAGGAGLGTLFGFLVMSRWMAALPGLTLTVVSVAGLFVIGNLSGFYIHPGGASVARSPFGEGRIMFDDLGVPVAVTHHRLVTLGVLCAMVIALTVFLNTTYTGLAIRAIADDVEASVWCGAKLRAIGTGVYGASGGIAALAGALFAAAVADPVDGMLVLFIKGLLLAVVGALRSVALALLAAVIYAVLETALIVGFFGQIHRGLQDIVLSGTLLLLIVVAARWRKDSFFQLQGHTA